MVMSKLSLEDELTELRRKGYSVTASPQPDGWTMVVFDGIPVPVGYNKSATKLLIKVPPGYPAAQLDMFWTDPDLTLSTGGSPQGCSQEQALGTPWLRFSWHAGSWNPAYDNLRTYLSFIQRRLRNRA